VHQQAIAVHGAHGAVAPHRSGTESGRQDLLIELPHRDLVVVGVLAALSGMMPAFGITGGTSSGVTNFGTAYGSSVPPGIAAAIAWRAEPTRREQRQCRGARVLRKVRRERS